MADERFRRQSAAIGGAWNDNMMAEHVRQREALGDQIFPSDIAMP